MTCSNFEPSFEKSCHLCFSSFRGRLFEGKRLGFCKKVGWLTFNLQRAQFSLDCGFLLNNPTLGEPESRNQFRISCSRSGSESVNKFRFYISPMKISDSYFYHFYFCPDPCSSVKPGVHTVGRSVGRRALLFTACPLSKWHFDCWKKWPFWLLKKGLLTAEKMAFQLLGKMTFRLLKKCILTAGKNVISTAEKAEFPKAQKICQRFLIIGAIAPWFSVLWSLKLNLFKVLSNRKSAKCWKSM